MPSPPQHSSMGLLRMMTLGQDWMSVQSNVCPLYVTLDVAGIRSATAWNSGCSCSLNEAPVASIQGCLLIQPFFALHPCAYYHHSSAHLPSAPCQRPLGCKVCSLPQQTQSGPADRLVWGEFSEPACPQSALLASQFGDMS